MVDARIFRLIPETDFNDLMAQVASRLAALPPTGSRYQSLIAVAAVHQEFGNALSGIVYARGSDARVLTLACKSGCATCCIVPSEARGFKGNNFSMSILDVLTLVENFAKSKEADPALPEKAANAVLEAQKTKQMVACPHLSATGQCGIYAYRPVACKIWFSAQLGLCIRHRDLGYPGCKFARNSDPLRGSFRVQS